MSLRDLISSIKHAENALCDVYNESHRYDLEPVTEAALAALIKSAQGLAEAALILVEHSKPVGK